MRPGCGLAVVSEWTVESPAHQRAVMDAFGAVWAGQEWPQGMLSGILLAGNDGESIVVYGQWTGEEAYRTALETHLRPRAARVDQLAPGTIRSSPAFYRLHRSRIRDTAAMPGCIILITFNFASPDAERQKDFISAIFRAVDSMPDPPVGAIGGHLHISTDGMRVLNFAEWTSEEAHRRAVEDPARLGPGPQWAGVRSFPGLEGSRFQRYTIGMSLERKAL